MNIPRLLVILLIFIAGFRPALAQNPDVPGADAPYFVSHPTLTPDGQTIIFSYEGDLWKVPVSGGQAVRITAMDGVETRPSVSPDGNWLAFSSGQFGNMDVYVMPIGGGDIRQLTWHEATDELEGWSWDSSTLYFTSNRENRFSTWQVKLEGGTPARLFRHYHVNDHNLVAHPDGSFLFNTSWESKNQAHRKGYRGAFAPQIEQYYPDLDAAVHTASQTSPQRGGSARQMGVSAGDGASGDAYRVLTSHDGKDMWPSVSREGDIYYVSDASNGEYNLYRLSSEGAPEQLTEFATSIKHPRVSADGSRVVFTRDYQLWIYDVADGQASPVIFNVFGNSTLEREQDFRVQGNITAFDVSPDTEKLAFVSRGELFVSDAEGKFVQRMSTRSDGRVMEVYWLDDNRTILFNQTWNGYQNWFTMDASGNGPEVQRTSDLRNNRGLRLSNDRTQAVYLSGRDQVRLMDLSSFESRTVVEDQIWDIQWSRPSFSPDDRYILFTAYRTFEQNIYVHELETAQTLAITDTYVSETQPFWSPDGTFIYFQTNRTRPAYPYGMRDSDIYRIALDYIQPPLRSGRVQALFEADENDDDSEKPVHVTINAEGLADRWQQIGPSFGTQTNPFVHIDGDKTYIVYRSNHDEGRFALWKTVFEPFESPVTEKIAGTEMWAASPVAVDGKHWLLLGGDIHTLDLSGGSVKKLNIRYTFQRNLRAEFDQMFEEMWANLESNFYSEDFHGRDWEAIRERYRRFLPFVRSRADLRELKNDMLGELNTSHIGFGSSGSEEDVYHGSATAATGIVFVTANPFEVRTVVRGARSLTAIQGVQSGDLLTAVNGVAVAPGENRERYFSFPSRPDELVLRFERDGQAFERTVTPVSYAVVRNLLYDEWMQERQEIVDESSEGRIAYIHMKNMGGGELQHFLEEMVSEGQDREALILDLRYNTGGNVHDEVLRFLSQRPYLNWGYRGGPLAPQSNFTPGIKPTVLLINEHSLSDAEMTAAGFRELGLGTIVGMETYRWIIFTSGAGLVDGSFYRLPSWGVYTFTGENLEFTGVAPDVEVPKTFVDRVNDRDPQLHRAIEIILEKLEE